MVRLLICSKPRSYSTHPCPHAQRTPGGAAPSCEYARREKYSRIPDSNPFHSLEITIISSNIRYSISFHNSQVQRIFRIRIYAASSITDGEVKASISLFSILSKKAVADSVYFDSAA